MTPKFQIPNTKSQIQIQTSSALVDSGPTDFENWLLVIGAFGIWLLVL
jgi:hypothetical protein